jgi:hypothetical protein
VRLNRCSALLANNGALRRPLHAPLRRSRSRHISPLILSAASTSPANTGPPDAQGARLRSASASSCGSALFGGCTSAGGKLSAGSGTASSGVSTLFHLLRSSFARPPHAAGTPACARHRAATPARARRALCPTDLDAGHKDGGVHALRQDVRPAASLPLVRALCVLGVLGDGRSYPSCFRGMPGLTAARIDEREGVEQGRSAVRHVLPQRVFAAQGQAGGRGATCDRGRVAVEPPHALSLPEVVEHLDGGARAARAPGARAARGRPRPARLEPPRLQGGRRRQEPVREYSRADEAARAATSSSSRTSRRSSARARPRASAPRRAGGSGTDPRSASDEDECSRRRSPRPRARSASRSRLAAVATARRFVRAPRAAHRWPPTRPCARGDKAPGASPAAQAGEHGPRSAQRASRAAAPCPRAGAAHFAGTKQ